MPEALQQWRELPDLVPMFAAHHTSVPKSFSELPDFTDTKNGCAEKLLPGIVGGKNYMPVPGPSKSPTLLASHLLPCTEPTEWEQSSSYIIGSSLDLLIQLVLILIPEGRISHQENIQDDSYETEPRSLG